MNDQRFASPVCIFDPQKWETHSYHSRKCFGKPFFNRVSLERSASEMCKKIFLRNIFLRVLVCTLAFPHVQVGETPPRKTAHRTTDSTEGGTRRQLAFHCFPYPTFFSVTCFGCFLLVLNSSNVIFSVIFADTPTLHPPAFLTVVGNQIHFSLTTIGCFFGRLVFFSLEQKQS